jgi:hypothetical protein
MNRMKESETIEVSPLGEPRCSLWHGGNHRLYGDGKRRWVECAGCGQLSRSPQGAVFADDGQLFYAPLKAAKV